MTADLVVADSDDSVGAAAVLMRKHHIRRVPVPNREGTLFGVLSMRDLIRQEVREMRDYIALSDG